MEESWLTSEVQVAYFSSWQQEFISTGGIVNAQHGMVIDHFDTAYW